MHEVRRAWPVPSKNDIWPKHDMNSTAYVGMVTHIASEWINRVRLPILHVVS